MVNQLIILGTSLWILVRLSGISSGTFRMRFFNTLLPMSICTSSWFHSLISQRFSRSHTIWWQVLRFASCREPHSQENWFEMVIFHRQLPCFTSASTLLLLFSKLSMQILDFSSLAFLKIAQKFCKSTDLNLFFSRWRLWGMVYWKCGSWYFFRGSRNLFLFINRAMCSPYLPTWWSFG